MTTIAEVTPAIVALWLERPPAQRRRVDVQSFINALQQSHPHLLQPLKRGRGRPLYDPMMLLLAAHFSA